MKPINATDMEWLKQYTAEFRNQRSVPADVRKRLLRLGLIRFQFGADSLTAEGKKSLGWVLKPRGWVKPGDSPPKRKVQR